MRVPLLGLSVLGALLLTSLMFVFAMNTHAKDIILQWEPSPTPTVTGYKAHFVCGELVEVFPGIVDVGNVLEATLTGFDDFAECWFAVTAYDGIMEDSVYSNIVFSPGYVKPLPPGKAKGHTKIRGKQIDLQ